MIRTRFGRVLAAAGLAAIALATLGPVVLKGPAERLPTLCLLCGDFGTVDFVLNIALFVPFGLGLALAGVRPLRAVAIAATLTLAIESLQATLIAGRHAALGDLVANSLGGLLGATAPAWSRALLAPSRSVAAALTVLTAAVAISLAAAPVILFRPSPAPTETWWGQHAHLFGRMAQFEGTITSVTLSGRPIGEGVLPDQQAIKSRFGEVPLDFTARVIPGPIPPLRAQVAAIADGTGGWVAAIWQDGPDAIVSLRLGAADYLLRAPILVIPGAFAEPGTPVTVSVAATETALLGLASRDGQAPVRVSVPITTTSGWVLAWPWATYFERDPVVRTALWLLGWWLATGFLITCWSGRGAGVPLLLGLIGVALAVIPRLTGTEVSSVWEWGSALLGAGAGIAAGRGRERSADATRQVKLGRDCSADGTRQGLITTRSNGSGVPRPPL